MERLRGKLIALLIIVAVLWLLHTLYSEFQKVGINQGYEPDQPIAFSHKTHAGDNKIACLYCHFSAEKSRHAGIPPTNVCMNCHSVIKKDSPEIAKIYEALQKQMPIQWVKVHNLPDFVYFNHQQHVKAGVSCQDCHGPVERMTRMRQQETLSMGWCIECHRARGITPPKGNGKKMQEPGYEEKDYAVGGLDCAKCHY